jgi:hypothetical protein
MDELDKFMGVPYFCKALCPDTMIRKCFLSLVASLIAQALLADSFPADLPILGLCGDVRRCTEEVDGSVWNSYAFDKEGHITIFKKNGQFAQTVTRNGEKIIYRDLEFIAEYGRSETERVLIKTSDGYMLTEEGGTGWNSVYTFDEEGRLTLERESRYGDVFEYHYFYSDSSQNPTSFTYNHQRSGERRSGKGRYIVMKTDRYGNWTKRHTITEGSTWNPIETRTIQYYSSAFPKPVSEKAFLHEPIIANGGGDLGADEFEVVVRDNDVPVLSDPGNDSKVMGYVSRHECFKVLNESGDYYKIGVSLEGVPPRSIEGGWILKKDVRRFEEKDYAGQIYRNKYIVTQRTWTRQDVRKGEPSGGIVLNVLPGFPVEVIEVLDKGKVAHVKYWFDYRRAGHYMQDGFYIAMSSLKPYEQGDWKNAVKYKDLRKVEMDMLYDNDNAEPALSEIPEQEYRAAVQRMKNDPDRNAWLIKRIDARHARDKIQRSALEDVQANEDAIWEHYSESRPRGYPSCLSFITLQAKRALGLSDRISGPYEDMTFWSSIALTALILLFLCRFLIIWYPLVPFALVIQSVAVVMYLIIERDIPACNYQYVDFWPMIKVFFGLTVLLVVMAFNARLFQFVSASMFGAKYALPISHAWVILLPVGYFLDYFVDNRFVIYAWYLTLVTAALQPFVLAVVAGFKHGGIIRTFFVSAILSVSSIGFFLLAAYYIPVFALIAGLAIVLLGMANAPVVSGNEGRESSSVDESLYPIEIAGNHYREVFNKPYDLEDSAGRKYKRELLGLREIND